MSKTKSRQLLEYPDVIKALPEADMPFPGVKAWIVQAPKHQLIFFEFEPTAVVPEHSHPYPQWGILLKGGMHLTVNGKTRIITEGQEYLIPAGAIHVVKKFLGTTRVIDFFSEPARYQPKHAK
jgi:quercetin dioxygenase-like cupin family protein